MHVAASRRRIAIVLLAALFGSATAADPAERKKGAAAKPGTGDTPEPCPTGPSTSPSDIPRFGSNSPFDEDYEPPKAKAGKRIWARNFLWEKAPDLVVETWLSPKPDLKGKYVLYEFWATWCPPCRRSIPVLNGFHARFGKELVVVGISHETEAAVRKLKDPAIQCYSAIDTQARMKKRLGVVGIPHVIVVEPGGHVVWQGFPLLKNYELTDTILDRILRVGRKPPPGKKR